MKFLIGTKSRMTQIYDDHGNIVPVTEVVVPSQVITQIKTVAKDGYNAVQFGANLGPKRPSKALLGHLKGLLDRPEITEVRLDDVAPFSVGQRFDAQAFSVGDVVAVTGTSKGRGYAGVVKRHGFSGAPQTHGHKHDLRAPGSIGSTAPQRVFPGRRMAGRMGSDTVTVLNLRIAAIDADRNVIAVRGAVPGARGSMVMVRSEGDMQLTVAPEAVQEGTLVTSS